MIQPASELMHYLIPIFVGTVYEISHSPTTSMAGTQDEVVNYEVRVRFVDTDKPECDLE